MCEARLINPVSLAVKYIVDRWVDKSWTINLITPYIEGIYMRPYVARTRLTHSLRGPRATRRHSPIHHRRALTHAVCARWVHKLLTPSMRCAPRGVRSLVLIYYLIARAPRERIRKWYQTSLMVAVTKKKKPNAHKPTGQPRLFLGVLSLSKVNTTHHHASLGVPPSINAEAIEFSHSQWTRARTHITLRTLIVAHKCAARHGRIHFVAMQLGFGYMSTTRYAIRVFSKHSARHGS